MNRYGLERSEGVLLRYLSEILKVLEQTMPPALGTDEIDAAAEMLEQQVRGST